MVTNLPFPDPRDYMTNEEIRERLGTDIPPERLSYFALYNLAHLDEEPFWDTSNLTPKEMRAIRRQVMR